jgi:hypothetical protein
MLGAHTCQADSSIDFIGKLGFMKIATHDMCNVSMMSPFLVMRNTKHVLISFGTQLVILVPIHNVCNKGCGNISMICLGDYGSFVHVNLKTILMHLSWSKQ